MKYFIISIILFFSHATLADIAIFASDKSDVKGGIMFDVVGGDKFLYKADVVFANKLGGFGGALGYKINDLNIFLGVSKVSGESTPQAIDIQGVDVLAYDTGTGKTAYIELKYKYAYLRYSTYDIDYNYNAKRLLDNGKTISSDLSTNEKNQVLWLGAVFKF